MELETVNKLYLELSQITTAVTAKELALQATLDRYEEALKYYEIHVRNASRTDVVVAAHVSAMELRKDKGDKAKAALGGGE